MSPSLPSLHCPCGGPLLAGATAVDYDELVCPRCAYRRTEFKRAPDRRTIQEGGSESAFQGDAGRRFSRLADWLRGWSARHRAGRRLFGGARPRHIIDFGCGQGFLLDALKANGHVAVGLEISETTAAAAKSRGHHVVTALDALPAQDFDLLTSIHVLEHIPDPASCLTALRAHLTTDASFHVEVPNIASLQARLFGHRWLHFEPGLHVHHFSPTAFRRLLQGAGYAVTCVETTSLEHGLSGWVQSLLNLAFPYNRLFRRVALNRGGRAALSCWPEFLLLPVVLPLALLGHLVESALGRGAVIRCEGRLASVPAASAAPGSAA